MKKILLLIALVLPLIVSSCNQLNSSEATIEQQVIATTKWVTLFKIRVGGERCSGSKVINGLLVIVDGWKSIDDVHQEKYRLDSKGMWQPTGERRVISEKGSCILIQ